MSAVLKPLPMPIDEPLGKIEGPLVIEEQIKLMTLMAEPNEQMRKALRFYKPPEGPFVSEWEPVIRSMRHFEFPQDKAEFAQLLEVVRGKRSLLEVGSCFGGSLKRMAGVMAEGALLVSVDYPFDSTPKHLNPVESLKDACRRISLTGRHVELFVADSHDKAVVDRVRGYAPFEFGFIDGDHAYEGVKADWENYGPMCKVVAFHDIAGPVEGCVRFWSELKAQGLRTQEFVSPGKGFGIGVVFKE